MTLASLKFVSPMTEKTTTEASVAATTTVLSTTSQSMLSWKAGLAKEYCVFNCMPGLLSPSVPPPRLWHT